MNRFNFKTTIFCLAISLFTLAGCSKDDPNPTTEEINKSFIKKSYEEQVKDVDKELEKWEGKKYKLSTIMILDANGDVAEYDNVPIGSCEEFRTIEIKPKKEGYNIRELQVDNSSAGEGCPVYKSGKLLNLSRSNYSDYKVQIDFQDTFHDESSEIYKGILQMIDGIGNFFSVYTGRADSQGNFIPEKQYVYKQVNN